MLAWDPVAGRMRLEFLVTLFCTLGVAGCDVYHPEFIREDVGPAPEDAFAADEGVERSDASGPDAGLDGGLDGGLDLALDMGPPPFCAGRADAYLCLDFDDESPAPLDERSANGGVVAYVGTDADAWVGSSLSVTVPDSTPSSAFLEGTPTTLTEGTSWLRFRFWAGSDDSRDLGYLPLISLQQTTGLRRDLRIALSSERKLLSSFSGSPSVQEQSANDAYPGATWVCVEVEVVIGGDVRVHVDGSLVDALTLTGAVPAGASYGAVRIGPTDHVPNGAARTVLFDDVAWSPTRIPCSE